MDKQSKSDTYAVMFEIKNGKEGAAHYLSVIRMDGGKTALPLALTTDPKIVSAVLSFDPVDISIPLSSVMQRGQTYLETTTTYFGRMMKTMPILYML